RLVSPRLRPPRCFVEWFGLASRRFYCRLTLAFLRRLFTCQCAPSLRCWFGGSISASLATCRLPLGSLTLAAFFACLAMCSGVFLLLGATLPCYVSACHPFWRKLFFRRYHRRFHARVSHPTLA